MFNFTPLYGAQSSSSASASLLELDGGIKILVDLGWDVSFSTDALEELGKHVSTLSFVLFTHPTLDHLGAYAHACKHIPSFTQIPVYATIPVSNLGLTLLTDLYASTPLAASTIPSALLGNAESTSTILLQPPTIEEISRYFNHITTLKYSQPHQPTPSQFSPSLNGLTITAYAAGHTLGGTIWHIQHGMESIVYATDWNQGRENLLGGAAWLSSGSGGAEIIEALRRPTALICSSRGIENEYTLTRKRRDDNLVSLVRATLIDGGTVLIPTDSSARVLELAFLLNQTWRANADGPHAGTYINAKVYMASKSAITTQRFLQSMLEWMDDSVVREAEAAMTGKLDKSSSPLDWDFVRLIERQGQLDRALKRNKPTVILASDATLEWGYSRYALEKIASDSRNLVLLTELDSSLADSLGAQLQSAMRKNLSSQPDSRVFAPTNLTLRLRQSTLVDLDSNEQALYAQYMARQQAMSTTTATLPTDGAEGTLIDADIAASDSEDSEDEGDEELDAQHQGRALNISAQLTSNKRKTNLTDEELGVDILLTARAHDFEVQGKRGRDKMYPLKIIRKRGDDFGDTIVVGDYLRAEEKEELDNDEAGSAQDRKVGEKRKWTEMAAGLKTRPVKHSQNKKIRNNEPDAIDAAIAKATGTNGTDQSDFDSDESEYEPDDDDRASAPIKVSFTTTELQLSARLAYVDFAARHEKRDLLMLIPLIRPRKLIFISGTASETTTLAEAARSLLQTVTNGETRDRVSGTEVYTPMNGESVDASVDTNAWTLKLGRNLLRKLVWQDIGGIGIVALTGLLQSQAAVEQDSKVEDDDDVARKKRKISGIVVEGVKPVDDLLPVLDLPEDISRPRTQLAHAATIVNKSIHVGDLRLSDLRNLLRAAGHLAEFRGEGTLLVDGVVVVRKGSGGRIEVEGGIYGLAQRNARSSTFNEVRRKVYEGLAVVGGGHANTA